VSIESLLHDDGGVNMSYIPDLTEQFPEGFGGVDMTDSYFSPGQGEYDEFYDIHNFIDDVEEIRDVPKVFKIDDTYEFTDWFTGGVATLIVVARTDDTVTYLERRREIDGEYEHKRCKKIVKDAVGDEYFVMYEYGGDEARVYAE